MTDNIDNIDKINNADSTDTEHRHSRETDDIGDEKEDRLSRKVDDAKIEGWRIDERHGDRVVMVKHRYGSLGAHILIFLLTFWTFGFGNLLYAAYVYFLKPEKRVIRAE